LRKLKDEEDAMRIKLMRIEDGQLLRRSAKFLRMELETRTYLEENKNSNYGLDFVFGLVRLLFYEQQ
jgi:hypothetical protein